MLNNIISTNQIATALKACSNIRFPFLVLALFISLTVFSPEYTYAQKAKKDSTLVKKHSPTKAALFSAVLPGLGQAYNKKYWKIPIVYAGFGAFTYFIISNSGEYKKFLEAYNYVAKGDTFQIDNEYTYRYSLNQLQQGKDYYRRNMEISIILTGLWYILNILDATVDAHFVDFDISDDLSLRIDPMIDNRFRYTGTVTGLKLTLNF